MGGKENHNKSGRDIAVLNRVGSEGLLAGSSFWRMGGWERAMWIFWEKHSWWREQAVQKAK